MRELGEAQVRRWITKNTKTLLDCRIFKVMRRDCSRPEGAGEEVPEGHDFFFLKTPDFVNIVAITDDDRIVMVRQWRAGSDGVTLEVPGGQVDGDESSLEAAKRELREETGYAAERWELLGTCQPNPAIMDNHCSTWLASGAERVAETHFDTTESCELLTMPFSEALERIGGEIDHAIVITALHFELARRLRSGQGALKQ